MKKLFTLLFALAILFSANAQVLEEGFETGSLPTDWTQFFIDGTHDWEYQSGGVNGNPSGTHSGTYNAIFYGASTDFITKLITPALDLSAGGYQLKFWHTQEVWPNDQDQLEVFYKEGVAGDWISLAEYITSIADWTEETIALPTTSSEVYIAFEGRTFYGYGVCLDDVLVELAPTTPVFAVNPESHDFGTNSLYDVSVSQDFVVSNVGIGTLIITSEADVVISGTDAVMFVLSTSETYPINLASAETVAFTVEYAPTVAATHVASLDITDNTTKATHNIALNGECFDPTLTPPFIEDFEPTYDDTENWLEFQGILADPTVVSGEESDWLNDGFGNVGSDGSARINIYGSAINDWMITPPIDLGTDDYRLEFDLALTDNNSTDPIALSIDEKFVVVISTDNGATWSSTNVLREWGSNHKYDDS